MSEQRQDARIIRALLESGDPNLAAEAREMMLLPLVVLPLGWRVTNIDNEETFAMRDFTGARLDRPLFDDALYCSTVNAARVVVRVTLHRSNGVCVGASLAGCEYAGWLLSLARCTSNGWDNSAGTASSWSKFTHWYWHDERGDRVRVENDRYFSASTIMRFVQMVDFHSFYSPCPVEVGGVVQDAKKHAKTCKLKPWLRTDLRRVIFIDPQDLGKHGHPSSRTVDERHAPRPHQRRGHFKTLRSERFKNKQGQRVYVRPAWVGDREWKHDGATYKFVGK